MSYYIGIDLGTTNSAICSYDGKDVRIWKSPEQNDVTPSAIFVDRRGNRYYGAKAYNQAPHNPANSATLFKRFMGTTTTIKLGSGGLELTPEECSAEILKVLYGYLPEEIRNDPETAVVITVPAAFNQMKKDATLQAAQLAGLGKVALMQEPVAAVMSIMRTCRDEGIFLVYDLGGGTFDVSAAEYIGGKVNLLAHGGIEMCGGRDIDRMIFNKIVVPWLQENFSLPSDLLTNEKYRKFCRVAQWAAEQAKIELSAMEAGKIVLSEMESGTTDEDGNEIYLDIDLTREMVDELIADLIQDTITASRETLAKAGLKPRDLDRIVFVGGPTNYKPLRDKVCSELSLPSDINVNPMTAVAEGASIFAESVDWSTRHHTRKSANKTVSTKLPLTFKYTARTSANQAKIICILGKPLEGYTICFTSLDTGWTSGNADLKDRLAVILPLPEKGENRFSVSVFDAFGRQQDIGTSEITVTKVIASVGAIPASHSIGIQVMDKLGGASVLDFLVNEGDSLPKKGNVTFRAGQTLKAGSSNSINIKLWEGTIQDPIEDNRYIGVLKIRGTDFDSGVIPTGAEIECEYVVSDSGNILLEVSVPCIGASFGNRNFYSRQEGQIDLSDVDGIADEGRSVVKRIKSMSEKVNDPDLETAKQKAESAAELDTMPYTDPEDVQKAANELLTAKKMINVSRQKNLKTIRQMELDDFVKFFDEHIRRHASDSDIATFENLKKSAQRSIDRNDRDFENILDNMRSMNFGILYRHDWFVIGLFHDLTSSPAKFRDKAKFQQLKQSGEAFLAKGNIGALRGIIGELMSIRIVSDSGVNMFDIVNIIKG